MFPFDIENLYTNIPIEESELILEEKLRDSKKVSDSEIIELILLVTTVMKQNYFCYKDEFYICNKKVAMGGPLLGTSAQIFLMHLEEQHIMGVENPFYKNIQKYSRLIDDTFYIFQGTNTIVNSFFEYVNSIHPCMQFTVEHMIIIKSINFLDLTVYVSNNNQMAIKIYRKPTTTDLLISFDSNHPKQCKYAVIRSLAHRAFNIPMCESDLQQEINIILQLGASNGFPAYIINELIAEPKNAVLNNDDSRNQPRKFIQERGRFLPITYFNRAST